MTRLLVALPDETSIKTIEAFASLLRQVGCVVDVAPGSVEDIAALDVVLSLARSNGYQHPDREASLAQVEKLRAAMRIGL